MSNELTWEEKHPENYEVEKIFISDYLTKKGCASEAEIRNRRNRYRGRNAEYRLARKVKGVVVGRSKAVILDSGKAIRINPTKPPDVVTEMFSFESKWLVRVPANIREVMEQARLDWPEGMIPVAVMGDRNQLRVYYIMEEKDFFDLHI